MDPRIRLTRAVSHLPADGELEMTQDSAFLFRAGEGSPGRGPGRPAPPASRQPEDGASPPRATLGPR